MEENTICGSAELQLDTMAVKERIGVTTSSLTNINQIPVFSDAFEETLEEKTAENESRDEELINQSFGSDVVDVPRKDIRSQLFIQTNSELIIRNDTIENPVQSFLHIGLGFIMIGSLFAAMIWFYGRKGKKNVDHQHTGYGQK